MSACSSLFSFYAYLSLIAPFLLLSFSLFQALGSAAAAPWLIGSLRRGLIAPPRMLLHRNGSDKRNASILPERTLDLVSKYLTFNCMAIYLFRDERRSTVKK